jgi:frataxin
MMKYFSFFSVIRRSTKGKGFSRLITSSRLCLNQFFHFEATLISQICRKSRATSSELVRFSSSSHHPTSVHSPHNDLALEDERVFHDIADTTLEELSDLISQLEASLDDIDSSLSQGVLNINLGSAYQNKTWVINKQTPNRQIWWSSPISGPRRFEYMLGNEEKDQKKEKEIKEQPQQESAKWFYTKDRKTKLRDLLKDEIQQVTGIQML